MPKRAPRLPQTISDFLSILDGLVLGFRNSSIRVDLPSSMLQPRFYNCDMLELSGDVEVSGRGC